MLVQAFELLEKNEVVIGPTIDGGYYLVGATVLRPELFIHDRMGTGGGLDLLVTGARALHLHIALTATSDHVDQPDDLVRLSAELEQFPSRAMRTAKWLSQQNKRR